MSLKESVTEGGKLREEGVSRRSLMLSLSAAPLGMLGVPQMAHAGGQLEEPLMDSVRTALSSAVSSMSETAPMVPMPS